RGRHEMPGSAGLSATDYLRWPAQMQKTDLWAVLAQLIPVLAFECRAAHHAALPAMVCQPVADGVQPRVAVLVVERVTGRHLGDVGLRMEIVGVGERYTQALRQCCPNGRLAGARHPHNNDG